MSNPACPFPAGSIRAAVWHYDDDWTAYLPETQQAAVKRAEIRDMECIALMAHVFPNRRPSPFGLVWTYELPGGGFGCTNVLP